MKFWPGWISIYLDKLWHAAYLLWCKWAKVTLLTSSIYRHENSCYPFVKRQSKIAFFFSRLSKFYLPPGTTPGQDRGVKTRPQGQLECANPQGSPGGGGWSCLELTDTSQSFNCDEINELVISVWLIIAWLFWKTCKLMEKQYLKKHGNLFIINAFPWTFMLQKIDSYMI